MQALDRLRRLDERWGVGPVMMRGQINRLREQAAADIPHIDPELERRGRQWAQNRLRPLREQRLLLVLLAFFGLLAVALTVLAVRMPSRALHQAAMLSWPMLVVYGIGRLDERRIARHVLLELPWERNQPIRRTE